MSLMIAEQRERPIRLQGEGAQPALQCEFAIGDWYVLPQLNRIRLRKSDEQRQLEPRLIKLLCYLAANEERVLSREALVQELWPIVVVNENSLTRAISELRKQLHCKQSTIPNYIETIPKRGYRLLPRVEILDTPVGASSRPKVSGWAELFRLPKLAYGSAASAACLCLLIALWYTFETTSFIQAGDDRVASPVALSDELLNLEPDYLGGEVQLSTLDESPAVVKSIATPVVSLDEKQYAFIQYDTAGSTIFLGGLGTAIEPVPVYFSTQHLFNLAWSPVGNNLLFAKQPTMTTNAVYSTAAETAELVTLNLNTLETSRLVKDINPADSSSSSGLNLT